MELVIEFIYRFFQQHEHKLNFKNYDGLNIRTDCQSNQLLQKILRTQNKSKWSISHLTLMGNPSYLRSLQHNFNLINKKSHTKQGWRQVENNHFKVVWFFDDAHSLKNEINFILYDKWDNTLRVYSDTTRLYGKKQMSVVLFSILLNFGLYIHVHASSIKVRDSNIIFLGNKHAGKSSMIRELVLANQRNTAPLTDNITILSHEGQISFIDLPFSDELRIFDNKFGYELISFLHKKSKKRIDFYIRSSKIRLSLTIVRKELDATISMPLKVNMVIILDRKGNNSFNPELKKMERKPTQKFISDNIDRDWIELWETIPCFYNTLRVQRELTRSFFSNNLPTFRLILPKTDGERKAATVLLDFLRRRIIV